MEEEVIMSNIREIKGKMEAIWLERCWKPNKDSILNSLKENSEFTINVTLNPAFSKFSPIFLDPEAEGNEDYKELQSKLNILIKVLYEVINKI